MTLNLKYAPTSIDECYISNENKSIVKNLLQRGTLTNTIIDGPIGTCKSTLINLIVKHYPDAIIVRINVLIEKISKILPESLESNYMTARRMNKKVIFVLDNFHLAHPNIQTNINVMINKYHDKNIIVLIETTNLIEINKNVQNIMKIIHLDYQSEETYTKYIKSICEKENATIKNEVIKQLYIMSNGDIRYTLNHIDALLHITNNITIDVFDEIFNMPSSLSIDKIINGIINGDDDDVIAECNKLIDDKFDIGEIMMNLFNKIIIAPICEDEKHLILEKLGKKIYKNDKYQKDNSYLIKCMKDIIALFR